MANKTEIIKAKKRIKSLLSQMNSIVKKAEEKRQQIKDDVYDRLTIDIYNLEKESSDQPQLYDMVKDASIDISYLESEAKGKLLEIKALVELWVRSVPKDFGFTHVTEKGVEACINKSTNYRKASRIYNKILHINRKVAGTLSSFDQRRSMLKIEAQLFFSDYFNRDTVVDWAKKTTTKKQADITKKKLNKYRNKEKLNKKQRKLVSEDEDGE